MRTPISIAPTSMLVPGTALPGIIPDESCGRRLASLALAENAMIA
jgi:hypothetical protein